MTIPNRSWRGAGAFAATAVVALVGGAVSAGQAAAHTPIWAVTCSEVTLDLTAYSGGAVNEVTVSVEGGEELLPTTKFGREYRTTTPLQLPAHEEELTIRLVIKAGDDDKFSRNESKAAPVCEGSTPPSAPTPSETPSTEPSVSVPPEPNATPSETATETAPAPAEPSASAPGLAETGSSSVTSVIGGTAVAVLLAGSGILWSVRKRRTTQD
ncbi:LAETG motif-containing sortase-dependent surface protein [Streptomyces sp. NPDC002911]